MPKDKGVSGAVEVALDGIRLMIRELTLMPGQRIGQEHVANDLHVSRAPIREALRILQSEGLVTYAKDVGYSVARLTSVELQQIYLMREALENILFESIPMGAELPLEELNTLNDEMRSAGERGDINVIRELNQQWHFLIFNLAPMPLVLREVWRLWELSHAYRSFYLYDRESRERVVEQHGGMIDALAARDMTELLRLAQEHRSFVPRAIAETDTAVPIRAL